MLHMRERTIIIISVISMYGMDVIAKSPITTGFLGVHTHPAKCGRSADALNALERNAQLLLHSCPKLGQRWEDVQPSPLTASFALAADADLWQQCAELHVNGAPFILIACFLRSGDHNCPWDLGGVLTLKNNGHAPLVVAQLTITSDSPEPSIDAI